MPTYDFKGLDKRGKEVSGVREAENEKALRHLLKKEGVFLTKVGKGGKKGGGLLSAEVDFGQMFERVTGQDIAILTRQLATLLKASIPVVDALGACIEQVEKPKLRKVISQVRQEVNEGTSLAVALEQHPDIFSPIFPNMVKSGEASGTLDDVLMRLAEFTEAQVKLNQKVKGAMTYPVIMVAIGALILAGMFAYVIPQITQIFQDTGQELPFITKALIAVSNGFRSYWWVGGLGMMGVVYLFRRWKSTKKGAYKWDEMKLKFPVFGQLTLMVAIGRFTKTLGTLLRSGVPLLTALDITKNVLANRVLIEIISDAQVAVKEGSSLAITLKRSGRFPPIVTNMIAIGERSGALEDMLNVVAEAYESQVEGRIAALTSLLEPIMIVGMGVTIGIIVFAVLLPILQLNEFVS